MSFWQHIMEACRCYEFRLTQAIDTPAGRVERDRVITPEVMNTLSVCADPNWMEEHVHFSPQYNAAVFRKDFDQLVNNIPGLSGLFDSVTHNYLLSWCENTVQTHAPVGLRLAILKASLPLEYQRTLFCVIWAILDSHEIHRSEHSFYKLILVCLTHDFGLLDIERDIGRDDHDHRSEANESPEYYEHVRCGVQFLNRYIQDIPEDVIQGVLEHHERLDGTGYPAGASGIHLNEFGQIVHLYDSMFSIYQKFLKPLGKTIAELRLIVSISAVTHYGAPANRALACLERIPRDKAFHFKLEDYDSLISDVSAKTEYVEKSIAIIQSFTAEVGFRHENPQLFAVQNSFIHIALAHYKMSSQLSQSIKKEQEEGDQKHETSGPLLEESYIVLREIIFHVDEFKGRLLALKTQLAPSSPIYSSADMALDKLSRLNPAYLGSAHFDH